MPTSGGPGAITRQATKSSTVSEFLSNAYTALELAIKLAPLIPVPFMSSMLASAQVIVDAANHVHDSDLLTPIFRFSCLTETKDIMEEQYFMTLRETVAKLNLSSSFLTNVREVRATVRRDVPYTVQQPGVTCYVSAPPMRDVTVAQRLSAFLDSEDPTSVQFHVQPPNDDGFMQKPWGYFSSAEHNISQNDKTIPAECQGVDNVSGKLLFQEIHLGYQMQSSIVSYITK
ncbi:hypothetical protein V8E52_008730 [Russula decolorans]